MGQQLLLDADEEHDRELQALGAVQRRERVESEIEGLAIPDLVEHQEQQLREVLLAEQDERGSESTIGTGDDGAGMKIQLKKARVTIMIWAKAHRNLAEGVSDAAKIDIFDVTKKAVSTVL